MNITYGTLKITERKIRLNDSRTCFELTNVTPHVVIKLKQLFPKIPTTQKAPFYLPYNNDSAADLRWFFSRYPFEMDKSVKRNLKKMDREYAKEKEKRETILLPDYIPKERVGLKEGQSIRGYQRVAVDFAEAKKKMLLIDAMGLGKTYEAYAMALIEGNLPLVIVMEPNLQSQWLQKGNEFIGLEIHAVKGNKPYTLPKADIYLVKYSQLSSWCDVLSRGWVKGIIFDEVQNLRTGKNSDKGIAAASICETVDFAVGMTGTLIFNYGIECWNIADILSPNVLGTRDEFMREWCSDSPNDRGVVKDPHALGAYLREVNFVLRRTREDVGQESKQRAPEIIEVSSDDSLVKDMNELAKKLAMRVVNAQGRTEKRDANGEFDRRLRQMTGIAKAKSAAAFTRMLVEDSGPTILFGYHHEVYNIWTKELADLNPAFFTGRETVSKKQKELQRFLSGETDLLIMSVLSGAGVDGLQYRCSNVVFGEADWSPQRHAQCIARADRDGQNWSVFAYYIMSDFGSDPAMLELLGLKAEQAHGIQDPNTKRVEKQVEPERIHNMAKSFLERVGVDTSTIQKPKSQEELAFEL